MHIRTGAEAVKLLKTAEQTTEEDANSASSPSCPATPSFRRAAPAPPRGAPATAARRSSSASPGLLRERLRHVRAATQALPYLLHLTQGTVRLGLALAFVTEIVAVAAQEVASRPVQNRDPPAASRSGTEDHGLSPPKLHGVQSSRTVSLTSSYSLPRPLRQR